MLTDNQARLELKALTVKYLKGKDPEYENLIKTIENLSRQVPIRGILERIRKFNLVKFTERELVLIDELLYMYG